MIQKELPKKGKNDRKKRHKGPRRSSAYLASQIINTALLITETRFCFCAETKLDLFPFTDCFGKPSKVLFGRKYIRELKTQKLSSLKFERKLKSFFRVLGKQLLAATSNKKTLPYHRQPLCKGRAYNRRGLYKTYSYNIRGLFDKAIYYMRQSKQR